MSFTTSSSEKSPRSISDSAVEYPSQSKKNIRHRNSVLNLKIHSESKKHLSSEEEVDEVKKLSLKLISVSHSPKRRASSPASLLSPKTSNSPRYSPKSMIDVNRELRTMFIDLKAQLKCPENNPTKRELGKDQVYMLISRALSHEIFYFFDDAGRMITLADLDLFIQTVYGKIENKGQSNIREDLLEIFSANEFEVPKEVELIEQLWKMDTPKNTKKEFGSLSEEEIKSIERNKICCSILTRLYPTSPINVKKIMGKEINEERVPIYPPHAFLFAYKQFVSTPELFDNVAFLIKQEEDNMPRYQKLRLLNFCRIWFESNVYLSDKKDRSVQESLDKLLQTGFALGQSEINLMCYEIKDLIENWNIPKYTLQKEVNIIKIDKSDFNKCRNSIASDLTLLACESLLDLSILDDVKDATTAYFDSVVNYVVQTICSSKDNFNTNLDFFINLAVELFEKNDFFSCLAIYTALNKYPISIYIDPKSKKNKLGKLLRSKIKFLDEGIDVKKNYESLQIRIYNCKKENNLYVPPPSLIKHKMILTNQQFDLSAVDKIDVERDAQRAEFTLEMNDYLQRLKTNFIEKLNKEKIQTNIQSELAMASEVDEAVLDRFKKLIDEDS